MGSAFIKDGVQVNEMIEDPISFAENKLGIGLDLVLNI